MWVRQRSQFWGRVHVISCSWVVQNKVFMSECPVFRQNFPLWRYCCFAICSNIQKTSFFFRKFPSYRFAAFKRVDCGAVQDRYTVPPRPRHLYFASVSLIFVAISFLYFCSLHFATLIFENSFQDSVFCISESYIWELLFSILHLWSSYHFSIFTFARLELCFVDFSRQFQTTQDANRLQT